MSEWHLNPDTWAFIEEDRPRPGGYTWQEFQDVARPPCPACGTPIYVDAINVQSRADPEPMYIPGRMSCPNGCQPRRL